MDAWDGTRAFLEMRIIVSEARRSRSLYQWPSVFEFVSHDFAFSPSLPVFFFNLIVKGPWCDRDDRRGDRIADVNDSQSLLSCHDLGTKGARTLSPFPYSSFSLFLLCFLPSRHREIRSRRRSAALKPRAGNGSRRPEAKCVRALSDRDGGGAVVLFLSRPCGLPAAYIRAGF